MGFSIIIPVKEINDYILESVPITLKLDYTDFEIIILPNSKPESPPVFSTNERVKIIPTGKVSPAVKRDIGAEHAKYEYLAFLDDDAYPAPDWLKVAEKVFQENNVSAIGGPGITPPQNTLLQKASGLFYETYLGGGGMDYRYIPSRKPFLVDDYPTVNLIVSKKAFDSIGGFDNEYWPGEDTKFCHDLVEIGHKILYSPHLIVWHHRRSVLAPHLKQVGNYGKHRGYFAKKFPRTSLRLTYFVPSIFLIGNIGLALLSLLDSFFLQIWALQHWAPHLA